MTEKNYTLRLEFSMTDSDGLQYNTSKTAFLAIDKRTNISRYLKFVDDIASFQKTMKKLRRKEIDEITIDLKYNEFDTETYNTVQSIDFYNTLTSALDFTNSIKLNGSNEAQNCGIEIEYSVDMGAYAILEQFAKAESIARLLSSQK